MNAVIYARYSHGPGQTEQSIEGQIRDCMEYAKKNDLTVIDTYIDRSISGTDFENRVEFNRLIRDCERHQFSVVIVWKIDRFGRNREEIAMNKVRMKKHGVRLVYAKEHIPDGPEGIILESLLEGMAEYYSAELSQKVRRGLRESMLKGHALGANPMTGYVIVDKKYVVDPAGAAVVRELYERYASGETATDIMNDFNFRGITTAKGTPFKKSTIYDMLRNEKYIGTYRYGTIVAEGAIEPILEPALFQKVQGILAANCRNRSRKKCTAPEEFLLTGKVFCGNCGEPIIGESGTSRNGSTYYYYKCSGRKNKMSHCKKKTVRKETLESYVINATRSTVLVDDLIQYLANRVVEIQAADESNLLLQSLQRQLKQVEKSLANLLRAVEMGIITETTRDRMVELENQKQGIKIDIARAEIKKPTLTAKQVQFWLNQFQDGSIDDPAFKIRLINTFIRSIVLFDDRVVITYNFCQDNNNNRCTLDFDIETYKKNGISQCSTDSVQVPATGIEPVRVSLPAGF